MTEEELISIKRLLFSMKETLEVTITGINSLILYVQEELNKY